MRLTNICRILTVVPSLALFNDVVVGQTPMGIFDAQTDVGRARASRPALYEPQLQTYLVAGSGQNMWGDRDDFHFVWKRMTGNFILSSVARFGDTLVTRELADVSLPDTVYVGLFVCAHNDTVVERATFSNVRITTPAKSNFRPYTDYIGSN